jgi:hypothetical protein
MFSVITNIYNKKTIGPTLMELFTATGKLKKFFFTNKDIRCVHHGWHGTHRYGIQVLATHSSTWVHRYSSLMQWSVPLGQRGHVVLSVGGSFAYFAQNARYTITTDLLVWYSNTQNHFSPGSAIFSLHTFTSPSGRNVNYDLKKKQLIGKNFCEWVCLCMRNVCNAHRCTHHLYTAVSRENAFWLVQRNRDTSK